MRRVMLLLTLLDLPCTMPLAAQSADSVSRDSSTHGIGFGYFATLGYNWQIEALEIGYVQHPARGPAALGLAARFGTFMEESAVVSAMRGAVVAVSASARTHMRKISELGREERPIPIGLDLTFEATTYVAASSPFWQGSHWFAVSILPSLRAGRGAITVGPTLFFGKHQAAFRAVLAIRAEKLLTHRSR